MNHFCMLFDPTIDYAESEIEWIVLDAAGRMLRRGVHPMADIGALVDADEHAQLIVIVAGDRILTTEVQLEPQHAAHIRNVLPYMVEEQIAEELDEVHIAPAPGLSVGKNSVAVVSHTELIDWLDQLYGADLHPHMIVPECMTLPDTGAGIRVMLRGNEAVVQFDAYKGTVLPFNDLAAYLELYLGHDNSVDGGEYLTLLVSESDQHAMNNADLLGNQFQTMSVDLQVFSEPSFALQAITAVRNKASMLNLLQGGYRNQEADGPRFPWPKLAGVAATFLVLELVMLLGSGAWFANKADQLEASVEQEYRDIFPNERRVVDARRQFQSHLNRQRSAAFSDEFLFLMERVVSAMGEESLPLKSLRYNAYGEGLMLDLNASSMDSLEQYTTALMKANLDVELLSAVEQDDSVKGRIRVDPI